MSFGLGADEAIARSMQGMLGEFMYGQPMVFDVGRRATVEWAAFGNDATGLNITAGGADISEILAAVKRCQTVTEIMTDVKNDI
jgi:hypothetical protein